MKIGGHWVSLYRFSLAEQLLSDYEMANWYLSTHPASRFVTGLLAARPSPDRRYALLNNQFTIHHRNGGKERRLITASPTCGKPWSGPSISLCRTYRHSIRCWRG